MQRLEVSGEVRSIYGTLGVKRLRKRTELQRLPWCWSACMRPSLLWNKGWFSRSW